MGDGTIGGPEELVMKDFEINEAQCLKIGLSLNINKCEIINGTVDHSALKLSEGTCLAHHR